MNRIKNPDVVFPIAGTVYQEIPDVTSSNFLSAYNVSVAPGDFVTATLSSNGQQFTEISLDPLSLGDTQTIVEFNKPVSFPCYAEIEASISQRTKGDYFTLELTDKDTSVVDSPTEFNVLASYTNSLGTVVTTGQTTTTLTIVIDGPFDGYVGSWVSLYGFLDSRFNYTNLAVATISSDKKSLTFTTSDEATIPSFTANPASIIGAKLKRQSKLMSATNAVAIRFSGTSSSSASFMTRFGGGSIKEFGTLAGSRLVTNGNTATQYISGANGQLELKANTKFRIDAEPEQISFLDKTNDNITTYQPRVSISAVKPNMNNDYYVRLRGVSPQSIAAPVAKIVSIAKTGTTTATVTTAAPHGLNAASYVQIVGVRDQTNFPNLAAATLVASVIDSTRFTIVIGGAVTATSYSGAVILCNGGVVQQGLISQVVQSFARNANGLVTLIGSGTWAGFGGIGEYVNVYGLRDNTTGADLGFDGVYKIHNAATTTLLLEPVSAVNGLGQAVTPTGGVVATTNCGGIVLLRTTFRSFDILLSTYNQTITKLIGQGTSRNDLALPIFSIGGAVSATQSTAASISATTGLGGWYMHPAITGITDIALAAITATSTGSAIANSLGNGFQINVAVTAVSGTSPTMDVSIDESYDGGTNWVRLYDMQRITVTGSYNTPILRASGRHIRIIRTVAGTSPSFTNAVVRNVLPFIQAEPQKRLIDRTIVLTTLGSTTPILFQGAANNVQLTINLGAATTPPAIQLEGSEDGVNFYTIGSPLAGVASSTVQLTISSLSSTYVRAKVTTVGATVTAGYVAIKAWS